MEAIQVIGIHIPDKEKKSVDVQEVLSRYGCSIKTRLGLNVSDDEGKDLGGLLLLELTGFQEEIDRLRSALSGMEGVSVEEMRFPL